MIGATARALLGMVLVLALSLESTVAKHVLLTKGMTWANLAWGFNNGGKDSINGMKLLLVDPDDRSKSEISAWKDAGHIVMCYLSVGTIESWRTDYQDDKAAWDVLALGKMSSWDESWVDIRKLDDLMVLVTKRVLRLRSLGCDAVEPDNMDCFDNEDCTTSMSGTPSRAIVKKAQIEYAIRLADLAHSNDMAIVVKNAAEILPDIHEHFDGVITENCIKYNECGTFKKHFADNGKGFFATEYSSNSICSKQLDGMSGKYCAGNKGAYLCLKSVSEWQDCLQSTIPLPETQYSEGGEAPPEPTFPLPLKNNSEVVQLQVGLTWANKAWGFDVGGKDSLDGMQMVLVDLDSTTKEEVESLLTSGHIVTCYFSVGTVETFRPDYATNKASWDSIALGKMTGFDEAWIDIRKTEDVLSLMKFRFDRAREIGCQVIEADNIDCSLNQECWGAMDGISSGVQIKADQISYIGGLSDLAHSRGMGILMKNAVEIIQDVHHLFDGAVTENCLRFKECDPYKTYFVSQGKPHFDAEYNANTRLCDKAYKGMMVKLCNPKSGGYLCKENGQEWTECFSAATAFSLPEYVQTPTPRPSVVSLKCVSDGQGGLVSSASQITPQTSVQGFIPASSGISEKCFYIDNQDSETKSLSLSFSALKLKKGQNLRVYQTQGLGKDNASAASPVLIADLPGGKRIPNALKSFRTSRGWSYLLVLSSPKIAAGTYFTATHREF